MPQNTELTLPRQLPPPPSTVSKILVIIPSLFSEPGDLSANSTPTPPLPTKMPYPPDLPNQTSMPISIPAIPVVTQLAKSPHSGAKSQITK